MSEPKLVPTRVSALASLTRCPGFAALRSGRDGGSAAADTGSAAGRLVELYHRGYMAEDAMRQVEHESGESFPRADLDEAKTWALFYMQDPRNRAGSPHGEVIGDRCEAEVRLSLPAAPEDSTREPVVLVGHVDQVRRHPDGVLRVWDVKTGKAGGIELVHEYALQLAAYALACTETWGEPCLPGGIIRMRGYTPRGGVEPAEAKVFFETPWSLDQCRGMLDSAVWLIAALRDGLVPTLPGTHCRWCPAGGPHLCGDLIADMFEGAG